MQCGYIFRIKKEVISLFFILSKIKKKNCFLFSSILLYIWLLLVSNYLYVLTRAWPNKELSTLVTKDKHKDVI